MPEKIKPKDFTVAPGERFRLADFDPNNTGKWRVKAEARDAAKDNLKQLEELQEMLYAQSEKALLIVLQAMDAGGKDGTISHVMGATASLNSKAPSAPETHIVPSWGATSNV
jgi:polyphosphate kinase 2 (PPK2 family)